jgi:WD40 repeat protein
MNDDKFLYELREEMPQEFGKKLYHKLQQRERQRSFSTLAAALAVAVIGVTIFFSRANAPSVPDMGQSVLTNLEPITTENAAHLQLLETLGHGTAEGIAWSPDGTTIAVAGSRGLFFHNADDLSAEPRQINDTATLSPAYSPDGSVLSAISDNAIVEWNLETGDVLRRIEMDEVRYFDLLYSGDGTKIATIACDSDEIWVMQSVYPCSPNLVNIWDAVSGELLNTIPLGISWSVALNDDFSLIAWADDVPRIRVRSTSTDDERVLINGPLAAGSNVVGFHGDQLYALTPYDSRFSVWDTATIFDDTDVIQLNYREIPDYTGADRLLFLPDGNIVTNVANVNNSRLEIRDVEGNTLRRLEYPSIQFIDMALSPDSTRLVAIPYDGAIVEWDLNSGEQVGFLQRYSLGYGSLTFSADHMTLAGNSASYANMVNVWDLDADTMQWMSTGDVETVWTNSVALSPDGNQLAYTQRPSDTEVINNDTPIITSLMDLTTTEVSSAFEQERQTSYISTLFYAQDGTLLSYANGVVTRRAADGSVTTTEIDEGDTTIRRIIGTTPTFSNDGNRIALLYCYGGLSPVCRLNETRIYDTTTGEKLFTLTGGLAESNNFRLGFSADGTMIAVSQCTQQAYQRGNSIYYQCQIGAVGLWDISGEPSQTPIEPFAVIDDFASDQWLYLVTFSPLDDSNVLLFTWSNVEGTQMWSVDRATSSYQRLGSLADGAERRLVQPILSPDGEVLALAGPGYVELWGVVPQVNLEPISVENVDELQPLMTLGNGTANGIAWSPNGMTVAVAGSKGVFLHNADDLSLERQLSQESLILPTYSPNGGVLAGIDESAVVLFNAATREVVRRIETTDMRFTMLKFNADGTQIATTGCEQSEIEIEREIGLCGSYYVRLWDVTSGEAIASFNVWKPPQQVALNDDFSLLAWIDERSQLSVRSTTGDQERLLINANYAPDVLVIGFHANQFVAVVPRAELPAYVWDTDTLFDDTEVIQITRNVTTEPQAAGHNGTEMWFLDEERVLIAYPLTGDFELHNLTTGELTQLPNEITQIGAMALNPHTMQIVMVAYGAILKMDVVTSEIMVLLRDYSNLTDLTFSPNSSMILTGGSPTNERIWDLRTGTSRLLFPDQFQPGVSIGHAAFSPDGTEVVYAAANFTLGTFNGEFTTYEIVNQGIHRYDLGTGEAALISVPDTFNSNRVDAIHMLSDGTLLVIQSGIRTISRIAPDETISSISMQAPDGNDVLVMPYGAAISEDGTRLVMPTCDANGEYSCDDHQNFVWDAETGELLYRLQENPASETYALAFSQDGNVLALGQCNIDHILYGIDSVQYCAGGGITLWDVTGEASEEIRTPFAMIDDLDDTVTSIAISPIGGNDNLLLVASIEDRIEAWQINHTTGEVTSIGTIATLSSEYAVLSFSPNGEFLLIARSGVFQLWGVPEQ